MGVYFWLENGLRWGQDFMAWAAHPYPKFFEVRGGEGHLFLCKDGKYLLTFENTALRCECTKARFNTPECTEIGY